MGNFILWVDTVKFVLKGNLSIWLLESTVLKKINFYIFFSNFNALGSKFDLDIK